MQENMKENSKAVLLKLEAIDKAVELGLRYGDIAGSHHRKWVIDQMLRLLLGEQYEQKIKEACNGEDGPNTYRWDVGIAP